MTFLNQRGNVSWQNPKMRFVATSEICDGHGLFRVLHSVHRGVESSEKKCLAPLDIFWSYSKITNGSALPKGVGPCRGFTVGSEVLQGTDPIVRRLISTG